MAEGSYYETYPNLESTGNLIPPLNVYRQGESSHNYDDKSQNFYGDPYSGHMHSGAESSGMVHSQASNILGNIDPIVVAPTGGPHDYNLSGMHAARGNPSMYDPSQFNVKTEQRHMPPTPPGSPDDPKDLSMAASMQNPMGASGMLPAVMPTASMATSAPDMASAMNAQNMLAKPVAMRRLSEKSVAQARANYTTYGMSAEPPMVDPSAYGPSSAIARALSITQTQRRPRTEKKNVPVELKDNKYFERRKRNNLAAKKSRDSRKSREDEIAIRASFLEKENAILRAQVATLREEANSLRQLLLQKKSR